MAGAGGMGTVNEVEPEIGQTRECPDKPVLDRCPKDTVGFIFLIDPLAPAAKSLFRPNGYGFYITRTSDGSALRG
jgi:hypothetical protein